MQTPEDIIREQQRAVWNRFAPGWKKWDDFTMQFLRPMGAAIVNALDLQPTDAVLDVTQLADVSQLPFADAHFDAVSCRMGFMFFPSMSQAAQEMVRVLKPGGRFATSVWAGPEQNPWISRLMSIINRTLKPSPPPPDAPGMFRCAKPGLIAGLLEQAGLSDVKETVLSGHITYESPDDYWTNMNDIAAPVVHALRQTDPATINRIKEEVFEHLRQHYGNGLLVLPFSAFIIQGRN